MKMIKIGNCKWVSPIMHQDCIHSAIGEKDREDILYWTLLNFDHDKKMFTCNFLTCCRENGIDKAHTRQDEYYAMGDLQRL